MMNHQMIISDSVMYITKTKTITKTNDDMWKNHSQGILLNMKYNSNKKCLFFEWGDQEWSIHHLTGEFLVS